MKIILAFIILLYSTSCLSQTLSLSVSNPQPRLGDTFTISVDIDTISKVFFPGLSNQYKLSPNSNIYGQSQSISVNAEANQIGHKTIGPLDLEINGKKYTTNKIDMDVVDSLPAVNEGLWIRKMKVNDSLFVILIDQRIPVLTYITHNNDSITRTEKPDNDSVVELSGDKITNVKTDGSTSSSTTKGINMPGSELRFKSSFAVYRLLIEDIHQPVKLTKSDFLNLPAYYKFKDIALN